MKTMTDKELLELAARAAKYELASTKDGYPLWVNGAGIWNPLTDDGDALRLAVKLGLTFHTSMQLVTVGVEKAFGYEERFDDHNGDEYAATRRAIVRAAAEIGKAST